jgi:hypothetical protein
MRKRKSKDAAQGIEGSTPAERASYLSTQTTTRHTKNEQRLFMEHPVRGATGTLRKGSPGQTP